MTLHLCYSIATSKWVVQPKEIPVQFEPSVHQQRIFDRIEDPDGGSMVIQAVAGSGKTTTIVEAAKLIAHSHRAVFLAFNKSIADTLAQRLPDTMPASTFHSICFRAYNGSRRNRAQVDGNKVRTLLRNAVRQGNIDSEIDDLYGTGAINLVSKAKGVGIHALLPDDYDVWERLVDRFDIEWNGDRDRPTSNEMGIDLARKLLQMSNEDRSVVDFDDMLYLPLLDKVHFQLYDFVFIDEIQDLNSVQRALLHNMLASGGRLVGVGDSHQAIYGFRGADSDSMDSIRDEFQACELPLSISYRCPQEIVTLAKTIVPQIEAAPNAPEGSVNYPSTFSLQGFSPKDLVLCRNTAPLIELAYRCIASSIPVRVLGRDIGRGLITLIEKMKARDLSDLQERLEKHLTKETARLIARGQEAKAQALSDKVESIFSAIAGLPDCDGSVRCLTDHINSLFSDQPNSCLTLSTVHKAKGLEYPTVYILEPSLMPSKWARQPWQAEQELNLQYVAYTRAQENLVFLPLSIIK